MHVSRLCSPPVPVCVQSIHAPGSLRTGPLRGCLCTYELLHAAKCGGAGVPPACAVCSAKLTDNLFGTLTHRILERVGMYNMKAAGRVVRQA